MGRIVVMNYKRERAVLPARPTHPGFRHDPDPGQFPSGESSNRSPRKVHAERRYTHEKHPKIREPAQQLRSAAHLHELAHDDPDLDQGQADRTDGDCGARRRHPVLGGGVVDQEIRHRDPDEDQPDDEEPLVGGRCHS